MLADKTTKSSRTYNGHPIGFSKPPNFTKCQLSSGESKNNCILEPHNDLFQFRFRSANSFGKIHKMGPQKSHKIIQIALILAKTSFVLGFRDIRVCSDSLRVQTLIKKCRKFTIYLADMVLDSLTLLSVRYHQNSCFRCRIEIVIFFLNLLGSNNSHSSFEVI